LTQRDTFDEISRLRETIMRIKVPADNVKIPLIVVGSESHACPCPPGLLVYYHISMWDQGDIRWEGLYSVDKADLIEEREVDTHEAEKLAASIGCSYYETSAVSPVPTPNPSLIPGPIASLSWDLCQWSEGDMRDH
jgi:hypothetical protein